MTAREDLFHLLNPGQPEVEHQLPLTAVRRCPSQQRHAVPPGHPIGGVALPPAGREVRRVVKKALAGQTIHPLHPPKMSIS